jgi:hypothetical protein
MLYPRVSHQCCLVHKLRNLLARGHQSRPSGSCGPFCHVQSVDRILSSIFNRFNLEWSQHAFTFLHKQLGITTRRHEVASKSQLV